jgi:hypothetical protein
MTIQGTPNHVQIDPGFFTVESFPIDPSTAPATLSPDALMIYCESRLKGIDSQIDAAMVKQENVNWEQQQIQGLLSEISADQSKVGSDGILDDPQECQTLEQNIEDLITKIQQRDPGCSVIAQLEQLHDTVMATGTGPYTTKDASGNKLEHRYYCGSSSDPGKPPNGQSAPIGVNDGEDGKLGGDELGHFTNTLNGISSDLGSGAELQMIQIQSLMSQRTTAIQLTTNILQAYDDGLSKIAGNIGH